MYIETALVSSAGKLLIQLSDGQVIDAGYVKGSQGPPGRDGADGSPGIPGAKGDPGTNGAKWHTGVGAPEIGLGENGDLYMDVASALLPIYQKVNGDWLFLTNLKVPPSGGGGGQGGAAGGQAKGRQHGAYHCRRKRKGRVGEVHNLDACCNCSCAHGAWRRGAGPRPQAAFFRPICREPAQFLRTRRHRAANSRISRSAGCRSVGAAAG